MRMHGGLSVMRGAPSQRESSLRASHPDEWRIFNFLDKDQDGLLKGDEFEEQMGVLGYAHTAKALMAFMDHGSTGAISFDNFVVYWMTLFDGKDFKVRCL